MGHRIYSNDVLRSMEEAFGTGGDFIANQSDPERAAVFLRESLEFPDRSFDGALIWDTLQFLAPPLLQDTVDRLARILRPAVVVARLLSSRREGANRSAVLLPHCRIEDDVADPAQSGAAGTVFQQSQPGKAVPEVSFREVLPHARSFARSDRPPLAGPGSRGS